MAMGEFKDKLRHKLFRRVSATTTHSTSHTKSSTALAADPEAPEAADDARTADQPPPRHSIQADARKQSTKFHETQDQYRPSRLPDPSSSIRFFSDTRDHFPQSPHAPSTQETPEQATTKGHDKQQQLHSQVDQSQRPATSSGHSSKSGDNQTLESSAWTLTDAVPSVDERPELILVEPTPNTPPTTTTTSSKRQTIVDTRGPSQESSKQSLIATPQTSPMSPRKIWVRRAAATATVIVVRDDDMVDDAKDAILRKYGNSLGRHYDAPDITVRLLPRGQGDEVVLGPDEILCRAMDKYFPGGQSMAEALVVQIPQKRTPRQSPGGHLLQLGTYHHPVDEARPHESGTDYFPLMIPASRSPGIAAHHNAHGDARAMSVLTTGQVPPLASPGGSRRALAPRPSRPVVPRQHTASPTALTGSTTSARASRPRRDSASSDKHSAHAPTGSIPTPPAVEAVRNAQNPPTPRVSSPRPTKTRTKRKHTNPQPENIIIKPSLVDTSVPPINVLIVEDNQINMRLLEQFTRRLKVHWANAVNGREAVEKFRQGGFHLVLMDIQLPIMSGLDATREIRRLERANHIGVLSGSSHSSASPTLKEQDTEPNEIKEEDKLGDTARLFKSPVIIVALTASNLQSDRHEALAAGCNDFLTKPVNFTRLQLKVKEWGCMQALIDFDGWRKWKDAAVKNGLKDASNPRQGGSQYLKQKPAELEEKVATLQQRKLREDSDDTVTAGPTASSS